MPYFTRVVSSFSRGVIKKGKIYGHCRYHRMDLTFKQSKKKKCLTKGCKRFVPNMDHPEWKRNGGVIMARTRMEGTALNSWDEVNLNLKEIAECEMALEDIENNMNKKIQDTKLEAEMKAKEYQDRIAKLSQEVKEYTETHRDEIKGKTKVLNFGSLGFRQSTKIIIRNAAAVIMALKARKMNDCIQVKETVLKDKLKDYPDDVIVAVGAGKRVEDTFWYETDREKLKAI